MRTTGNSGQFASVSATRRAPREAASHDARHADQSTSECRALIPLSPVRPSEQTPVSVRQPASFLAHLIATRQALPQTRERRRMEPGVAAAIYFAASASREPAPGRFGPALSRAA